MLLLVYEPLMVHNDSCDRYYSYYCFLIVLETIFHSASHGNESPSMMLPGGCNSVARGHTDVSVPGATTGVAAPTGACVASPRKGTFLERKPRGYSVIWISSNANTCMFAHALLEISSITLRFSDMTRHYSQQNAWINKFSGHHQ